MRLLKVNDDGSFSLTLFIGNDIPSYAILSHTWEANDNEFTFQDLKDSTGRSKRGYKKIQFCGEQAQKDGLKFFWVDSYCTIQTHHRRQCPTKRVAYAAPFGDSWYIAFQYKSSSISLLSYLFIWESFVLHSNSRTYSCNECPK
jgi:hypothetical protein